MIEKQIITFVLKRNGKKQLSEMDFYLTLSMQLQWCSPKQAKKFVNRALQDKILIRKRGILTVGFSMDNIRIPYGFKPSSEFFESYKPQQTLHDPLGKTDVQTHILKYVTDKDILEKKVTQLMNEKCITKSVALLLYAKIINIDCAKYIKDIEKELITENIK